MKVQAENYKGIEFIRISKLPEDQKTSISGTLPQDQIIRILKDSELLIDCVQYKHYEAWYFELHNAFTKQERIELPLKSKIDHAMDQSHTPSGTISTTLPAGSSK